jgi:hypothetical protein
MHAVLHIDLVASWSAYIALSLSLDILLKPDVMFYFLFAFVEFDI